MAFIHRPLNTYKPQIRLFKLDSRCAFPAIGVSSPSITKPLLGTIQVADLDSAPSFRALSYTWGSDDASHHVQIDGQTFLVRDNLRCFLEEAGRTSGIIDHWLWIDQICIDQTSTKERAHQVSLMNRIYKSASCVIVWLGSGTIQSDAAMDFLATHDWGTSLSQYDQSTTWDYKSVPLDESGTLDFDELLSEPLGDSLLPTYVSDLFFRPYWSRLWIVQEFLLPDQLHIWCGKRSFVWPETISVHYRTPPVYQGEIARLARMSSWAEQLVRSRAERSSPGSRYLSGWRLPAAVDSTSLGSWMARFIHQKCSDQRDMVYGMLGLVPEYNLITVDYELSFVEILFKVLQHEPQCASSIITPVFNGVRREGQKDCDYDMGIGHALDHLSSGIVQLHEIEWALKHENKGLVKLFSIVVESMNRNPEWEKVESQMEKFTRSPERDLDDYGWYIDRRPKQRYPDSPDVIAARPRKKD